MSRHRIGSGSSETQDIGEQLKCFAPARNRALRAGLRLSPFECGVGCNGSCDSLLVKVVTTNQGHLVARRIIGSQYNGPLFCDRQLTGSHTVAGLSSTKRLAEITLERLLGHVK